MNIEELINSKGLEYKFFGCAPEGFLLVHEKTLEELKDFDTWKKWKNDEITINEINKIHFKAD